VTRLLRGPAAVHVPRHAAHVAGRRRAEEHRQLAQFLGRGELQRGLLLAEQLRVASSLLMPLAAALASTCFCTSGVSTQPGQIALQVTPVVAVSSATTLVMPTMPCLAAT
jgi:hypothetical protein